MKLFANTPKEKSFNKLIFIGFLFFYTCILLYLCYRVTIWEDESYSLITSSQKILKVIASSYDFEGQPPVYFVLLALWRTIDSGIFFARLFSIVSIGVASYFFYQIIIQISDKINPKWMVILFLLNPFTVWAALEIRLYAFLIFLSTTAIYFFIRYFKQSDNKYLYFFLINCLVGIYTQYFFAFLIISLALFSLLFKTRKFFVKLCLYLIPVAILSLPNLAFLPNQLSMVQSHKIDYLGMESALTVLHSIPRLIIGIEIVPGYHLRLLIGTSYFFVLTLTYLIFLKKYNSKNLPILKIFTNIVYTVSFLVILFVLSVLFTGIFYRDKYMTIAFPLFMLLFLVFQLYKPFIRNTINSIISIYFLLLLLLRYSYPIKEYNFPEVARVIDKIEQRKEPILFYNKNLLPPFRFYYHGKNELYALPPLKFDHTYYDDNIKDTSELKFEIKKIDPSNNSFILITNNISSFKYNLHLNNRIINDFFKSNYNIKFDTTILGRNENQNLRIRRLVNK